MRCWYCERSNEKIADNFFGDFNCEFCNVQNSCYDPNTPKLEKENKPKTTHEEWLENREEKKDMKPPKRDSKDFEKVAIGEMIIGVIDDVVYDQQHKFKGYQGAEDTIQPAVRLKFTFKEYKYHHYSRWFKFSYAEKSNLYKIFLTKLVENAQPDMDFDLDMLKGMKIKTVWNENGDFQNLESIFPFDAKIKAETLSEDKPQDEEIHLENMGEEQE